MPERAWGILRALGSVMGRAPTGFGNMLGALDIGVSMPKEIAISADDPSGPEARRLAEVVWGRYLPNRVLAVGRTNATRVPLLDNRPMTGGRVTAYVCERFVCKAPVNSPETLETQLA